MLNRKYILLLVLISVSVFAQKASVQINSGLAKPPVAPVQTVVDTYFGQKIEDPYRYMENQKDPTVIAWMKAQAEYTRAVLDSMPGRKAFTAQMQTYLNAAPFTVTDVQLAVKYTFYRKRKQGQNLAALYVREGTSKTERLLFDPNKFDTGGHHISLDQYTPSWDGKYVLIGASPGGSENQTARVIETATGRELPDSLERFEQGVFSLDGETIYYAQRQKLAPETPITEKYQKMKLYAHKLGSDERTDQAVFGYEVCPGVKVGADAFSSVSPAPGSSYAIGVVQKGNAPALEIYFAPLSAIANKTSWKKVTSYDDNVVDSALVGSDLYLATLKDAPNGKILRVSAADPDLSKAEVVLPASSAVLIGSFGWFSILRPAKDELYFQQAEAGVVKVLRLPYRPGSKPEPVSLPFTAALMMWPRV